MAIISIRDLVVEYDGRRVLNGLNLDIEQGETMVLLGGGGSNRAKNSPALDRRGVSKRGAVQLAHG
jgi:ABC-type transporter Mla maintaining outer membrane lipid asymmetry ATPase subunit MlaF